MRHITKSELEKILQQHRLWLLSYGQQGAKAVLHRADFRDTEELRGAALRDAILSDSDLEGADLRGTDLRMTDLKGVNLRKADLRGADLQEAFVTQVDLRGADLRGANLRGAQFWYVKLDGAQLDLGIQGLVSSIENSFTPDALPWLILHPDWGRWKDLDAGYINITHKTWDADASHTCDQTHCYLEHLSMWDIAHSHLSWAVGRVVRFFRQGTRRLTRLIARAPAPELGAQLTHDPQTTTRTKHTAAHPQPPAPDPL